MGKIPRPLDPNRPIKSNVTVSLTIEAVQALRSLAADQKISQSDVVEWAVLELRNKELPGR